ncbi:16525_t:CDS:1, partial [Gigaspora rosea]
IEVRTFRQQFMEAEKMIRELPTVGQKHSDHMYTSKLINTHDITESFQKLLLVANY